MDARHQLGRRGEDAAAEALERAGLQIVERNFRCSVGEVDIVATDGDVLVFCEVKTRRTRAFGEPSESVNPRKQQRLRRLAGVWLATRRARSAAIRFDVISIYAGSGAPHVEHIVDAF